MDSEESLQLDTATVTVEPDATAVVHSERKLNRSLIRSLAWNAAGDWISQIFTWAGFLVVTRLLTPGDFGIVAMAGSVGLFVQFLSGVGIPRAIVTLRELTDDQFAQLNSLGLMLGTAGFGLAALLAKPIAIFYGTPRVAAVVVVASLGLILGGAQVVSNGLLVKDMRFRSLSMYAAVGAVVNAAATLLFAYLGWGYWALVIGGYPGGILRAFLVMRTRRQTYAVPHWRSVERVVKFSMFVLMSTVAISVYQSLDSVTAGRRLGKTGLGLYGMAWVLAYVPLDKVTSLVTMVVPSYFAAFRDDLSTVRRTFGNLTEACALLMFPACVGLGIIANDFVRVVLGPNWVGAAAPLEVLSVYAAFRSIAALLPKLLTALDHAQFVMWNDALAIPILGVAFYTGSHWGIRGIAWGWVFGYLFVAGLLYRKTFVTIEMKVGEYFSRVRPALEGTIVMVLAVVSVKRAVASLPIPPLRLTLEILTGMVFYSATLWLRHRERVVAFASMVKSACRSEIQPAAGMR